MCPRHYCRPKSSFLAGTTSRSTSIVPSLDAKKYYHILIASSLLKTTVFPEVVQRHLDSLFYPVLEVAARRKLPYSTSTDTYRDLMSSFGFVPIRLSIWPRIFMLPRNTSVL